MNFNIRYSMLTVILLFAVQQSAKAERVDFCTDGVSATVTRAAANERHWKVFDEFFSAAALNQNANDISQHYSELDGSREILEDQLSRFDKFKKFAQVKVLDCLLYTSPSPRD